MNIKTISTYLAPVLSAILLLLSSCSTDEESPMTPPMNMEDVTAFDFTIGTKNYTLVLEKKTWANAAADAVSRGGYLVEINSLAEQNAVLRAVDTYEDLDLSTTRASDGDDKAYMWLGGNDIASEGRWVWDGDNQGSTIPFWNGDASGSSVDDAYTKWGDEPDNFDDQDGLAMGLENWPNGTKGQWNDLKVSNGLVYVVEFD